MIRPEPTLRVITPAAETDAQAATRLQREASERVGKAIENLLHNLVWLDGQLLEMAGLTAAPPGVREECRQLAAQVSARADTIMAVMGRGK